MNKTQIILISIALLVFFSACQLSGTANGRAVQRPIDLVPIDLVPPQDLPENLLTWSSASWRCDYLSSSAKDLNCLSAAQWKIIADNSCNKEVAKMDLRLQNPCPEKDCDVVGGCQPKLCPADYNPVCGKDGKTYSNKCGAAGVGVAYVGECGPVLQCPRGEVCGKDGKTYSNSCAAKAAQVAVDYQGACIPMGPTLCPLFPCANPGPTCVVTPNDELLNGCPKYPCGIVVCADPEPKPESLEQPLNPQPAVE